MSPNLSLVKFVNLIFVDVYKTCKSIIRACVCTVIYEDVQ